MHPAKVLVLESGSARALGDSLLRVLASSKEPAIEASRAPQALPVCAAELASVISANDADAAFVVLGSPDDFPDTDLGLDETPVFAATEGGRAEDLLELLHRGFSSVFVPPLSSVDVLTRLWHTLEGSRQGPPVDRSAERRLTEKVGLSRLIGQSPAFLAETRKIPLVARSDASVLISGETGTGKELVARAIHYLSARAGSPFVPVNCGAIPDDLVENELFGHERGAYTGAMAGRPGLVEAADGGTLFLDEIDSLAPLAQVKVLRFLQEGEFRRLGSNRIRTSDVRTIAAANSDIEAAVESDRLRKDLFYRLNVIPIHLPPLRERTEDIQALALHFLRRESTATGDKSWQFTDGAVELMAGHPWPGNVRELEHVVQRAVVLAGGRRVIRRRDTLLDDAASEDGERQLSFAESKARIVENFERSYVKRMLAEHGGNITRAAKAAKKNRRVFWELMRKHNIDARRFKGH